MNASSSSSRSSHPSAPQVSVIMPCHNAGAFIAEAMASVLGQAGVTLELIIIDDGSTDASLAEVRAAQAGPGGERIRLIEQPNQGAGAARNAGLRAARGDFIAFLDADDCWLPGKLATQIAYLNAHPDIGLVYARWQVWKADAAGHFQWPPELDAQVAPSPMPGIVPERSGWLYNRLLFGSLLHTITVVARRALIERLGPFDVSLKRGQDYDYWLRASRETEIHQLDRVMALYRIHAGGCLTKWPERNYELLVLDQALARWGARGPMGEITPASRIRARRAAIAFDFAYFQYWHGSRRLALRSIATALRLQPFHRAFWKYAILILFGFLWDDAHAPRGRMNSRSNKG